MNIPSSCKVEATKQMEEEVGASGDVASEPSWVAFDSEGRLMTHTSVVMYRCGAADYVVVQG